MIQRCRIGRNLALRWLCSFDKAFMFNNNFKIELVKTKDKYEGLRTLWCEVFGDEPSFVDAMYANFGADPAVGIYASDDICGYIIREVEEPESEPKSESESQSQSKPESESKSESKSKPESESESKEVGSEADICKVISALTCFRCGEFKGKPIHTSYAICTDPKYRGLGLAGSLVEKARDDAISKGGISLISPAEPSLEKFYGAHGYAPFFFIDRMITGGEAEKSHIPDGEVGTPDEGFTFDKEVDESKEVFARGGDFDESDEDFIFDEEDMEYEKVCPGTRLRTLDAAEYNEYRERFLEDIPHVVLSEQMLKLVQAESTMPDGSSGLLLINDGDAICAMNTYEIENEHSEPQDGDEISAASEDRRKDESSFYKNEVEKQAESDRTVGTMFSVEELILNPALAAMSSEIAEEIAAGIAEQFELKRLNYRTPGSKHCQSMAAGLSDAEIAENNEREVPAYYGFPIE